jgi:hypothetical protein
MAKAVLSTAAIDWTAAAPIDDPFASIKSRKTHYKNEDVFVINNENGQSIGIDKDLNVTIDPKLSLNEASKEFWRYIKDHHPNIRSAVNKDDYITYSFAILREISKSNIKLTDENKDILNKALKIGESLLY